MNKWVVVSVILAIVLIGILYVYQNKPVDDNSQIANPASVYCEEQGYNLEIRTDASGGQYGVCVFDDNSTCEEWAYYRGECKMGDNK